MYYVRGCDYVSEYVTKLSVRVGSVYVFFGGLGSVVIVVSNCDVQSGIGGCCR